jgi:hypothetical protein
MATKPLAQPVHYAVAAEVASGKRGAGKAGAKLDSARGTAADGAALKPLSPVVMSSCAREEAEVEARVSRRRRVYE